MTKEELLEKSFTELQAQMQRHREVMRMVVDGVPAECPCPWSACAHEKKLNSLLLETVQVLEETRKAFKSKQLEHLRKRLLRALNEELSQENEQKS